MKCARYHKIIGLLSLCAVPAMLAAPHPASAVQVYKTDKFNVDLYGQVDRGILYANDGNDDNFYSVDNDNSSTRIGVKAQAKASEHFTAGLHMEWEYQSNPSNVVWQDETNTSNDSFDKRFLDAYLMSDIYGKLTLGHGSTASDYSTEIDLSGTALASYVQVQAMAGGIRFYDSTTSALSDVSVSNVFNNLDGDSRQDRVRYDTPDFYGFNVAASTVFENGNDDWDTALRYSNKMGPAKVSGAISYVSFGDSASKDNQVSGSVSMLLDSGFNVTVAAGNLSYKTAGRNDASYVYTKIGYIAHLFSVGTTAFAVDYGKYQDMGMNDDDADTYGVMAVQKITDWHTELYLAYRNYNLDRTGTDFDSINAVLGGFRFKF